MTSEHRDHETDPPPRSEDGRRDRGLQELLRRALELGLEKLSDRPENFRQAVGDFRSELKNPREALGSLLNQLDETKSGIYKALGRELLDFLEQANWSEKLSRVLSNLAIDIHTEIRFSSVDSPSSSAPNHQPETSGSTEKRAGVRSTVSVRSDRSPPPEKDAPSDPPNPTSIQDATKETLDKNDTQGEVTRPPRNTN